MHIADYWKEKNELLMNHGDLFKAWDLHDIIIVRKMIIMKIMEIPPEGLTFYLKRDSWLNDFALNNVENLGSEFLIENTFLKKRDRIIETLFYKKDREKLLDLYHCQSDGPDSRQTVRAVIQELLKPEVYSGLNDNQKAVVELYETVYFCPIELLNGYIEEKAGSDAYYKILLEQWKTANEMASGISAQRNNMNNFYMSLMSILIGGVLFSDQMLSANTVAKTVLFITIAITGFICCRNWVAQLDNYGKLNAEKYAVINELERHLPANVMLFEWLQTEGNARKQKRKKNYFKQEIGVARLFQIFVIIVPVIMLIGTWWKEIWMVMQNL